jgi:prepilin-type N-terminal cleavage/methylation domain-containing protein
MAMRPGFSLLEMLVVMAVMSVAATIMLPRMGGTLAAVRVQRASTLAAAHIRRAHSTAARQNRPVRLSIDSAQKVMRIRDVVNPGTIYAEQRFDASAENTVQRLVVSDTSLLIYPTGMVAKPLEVRLIAAKQSRLIRITRAGQIRIEQ